MVKSVKQYPQSESFHKHAQELLGKQEAALLKEEAQLEAKILQGMQNIIQSSVENYMIEQKVGFNELSRRLNASPTYVSKMRKGQANLTIATFARFMASLGKDPFEFLIIKK